MSSVTNKIQDAAPRYRELLAILSETDHAPPALEHQKQYVADLNKDIDEIQKSVEALNQQRERELQEHVKYRDSVMKRFAYKVSGRTEIFEAKASKEEKDYLHVLQELHKAQTQLENLKGMRADALSMQSDFEKVAARHAQAHNDLDSLYNSIFQGPTPDFPEEDASERNAESALQAYHNSRMKLQSEQQAERTLSTAALCLNSALSYIENALDHSRMDMFGGGTISDMMEREALHKAENKVNQVQMLVLQAQRLSPRVQPLPPVRISQGSLVGDVLFDNIFSDMEFHDKIKASREELRWCARALQGQLQAVNMRVQECEADMTAKSQALNEARTELQRARERIFDRVTDNDAASLPRPRAVPDEAPPPYQS